MRVTSFSKFKLLSLSQTQQLSLTFTKLKNQNKIHKTKKKIKYLKIAAYKGAVFGSL